MNWAELQRNSKPKPYTYTQGNSAQQKETPRPDKNEENANLDKLKKSKATLESEIFECKRRIHKTEVEIKTHKQKDEEDARKDREAKSWWTYVSSAISSSNTETKGDKLKRDQDRLHRAAATKIKENELSRVKVELGRSETAMAIVQSKIWAEQVRMRAATEARAQAELEKRKQQEQNEQAEHSRRARERYEESVRQAREEQEKKQAEHSRRARERYEEAARQAREAQEKKQADARKKTHTYREQGSTFRNSASGGSSSMSCSHRVYWTRIDGPHTCSHCEHYYKAFAFQCPQCGKVCCANCRGLLKGNGSRNRPFHRRHDSGMGADFDFDDFDRW